MTSRYIQAPGAVAMIRPHRFHPNPETAKAVCLSEDRRWPCGTLYVSKNSGSITSKKI